MIKKLLFLSLELPTEEEFHTLSVFPGIFYMKGDFRKKKVLMKAVKYNYGNLSFK